MIHSTSTLAAILLAASASVAAAQTLTGAGSAQTATGTAPTQPPATASARVALPRVELGGGFTGAIPVSTEGSGSTLLPMANTRVGMALNQRWALEGIFDLWPESDDVVIIYRAQARWLFRGVADPGRLQPHATFGGTGWLSHASIPEYRWQDASGRLHVDPGQSYWSAMPPIYPTVGIGVQKTLGPHVALRADLAAIIIPFDDGAAVMLMPSVSLSFPIGRYETRRK